MIIGPRTFDQLMGLLDCSNIDLKEDTLDAIDEIVPPGTNISSDDDGYTAPEIKTSTRRRHRQSGETSAGDKQWKILRITSKRTNDDLDRPGFK